MILLERTFKVIQSILHAFVSKFEDPVKMLDQAIRDLKTDLDQNIKSVAEVKAIAIGTKKQLDSKKQIAKDYEQKALMLLKKANAGELDQAEADRLATEALKKQKAALQEIQQLSLDSEKYSAMLAELEKKAQEMKATIQKHEAEYKTLKARATVARTTKRINKQLNTMSNDSTMALIEDMKNKIQEEENLAEAYGEMNKLEPSIDDEINKAIGTEPDVQGSLEMLKQQLALETDASPQIELSDDLEKLKKELDS